MRILLKFVLDCEPDAAWLALRTPAVMNAVASPFARFTSLEPDGFPAEWTAGPHLVTLLAFRIVPVGVQVIDIALEERGSSVSGSSVRLVTDSGGGLTGPLALVDYWQHTMAVAPAPGGRTLYRDQLRFRAGPLTGVLWPLYWVFWQWRGRGIRRLAKHWRS